MYQSENNEPHPFHVKSNWKPQVQPSVTLESYLEELAEIEIKTCLTMNSKHSNN